MLLRKVLVLDPDPETAAILREVVAPPTRIETWDTPDAARDSLAETDLVFADIDALAPLLEAEAGDEQNTAPPTRVLKFLQQHVAPGTPLILTTMFGTVEDAVAAMRDGASDLLIRPFGNEQLELALDRTLESAALRREVRDLRQRLDERSLLDRVVTRDARMLRLFKTVRAVASARTTVLITGESGTGKSLLARALHAASDRADRPFVEINCGALPETLLESELFGHAKGAFTGAVRDRPGKFEEASGGTVFLDEIGTATPALQVRLLRVLQERVVERVGESRSREVDVRIVLATNADLQNEVAAGNFREDLYYRICVVHLEVPPLRDRPDDVVLLAQHFLAKYRDEHDRRDLVFGREALACMTDYGWPGNVRQLENVVERAVLLGEGDRISPLDLPDDLHGASHAPTTVTPQRTAAVAPIQELGLEKPVQPLKKALEEPERQILAHALRACGGNRTRAAAALDINRSTLHAKIRRYGLDQ